MEDIKIELLDQEKKLLNVNAVNWIIQKKRPVFFKE